MEQIHIAYYLLENNKYAQNFCDISAPKPRINI